MGDPVFEESDVVWSTANATIAAAAIPAIAYQVRLDSGPGNGRGPEWLDSAWSLRLEARRSSSISLAF
jgi:hypothetical protein